MEQRFHRRRLRDPRQSRSPQIQSALSAQRSARQLPVEGVPVLDRSASDGAQQLQRLNAAAGVWEPADWPTEFGARRFLGPIDGSAPALSIPIPGMPTLRETVFSAASLDRIIVRLNVDYLRKDFIPALVQAHFGDAAAEYRIQVSDREDVSRVIYSSEPGGVIGDEPDATENILALELQANRNLVPAERARTAAYDVIILDVMLPFSSGFDVCRDLRREGITAPVLMLTAKSQVADKVVGLKLGADDYLTKPFAMMELLARMEALLRRAPENRRQSLPAEVFAFGFIRVDFRGTEVFREGKPIELSAREFKLLRYFIEHRGQTLSRDALLNSVWGYDAMPFTRTVDVHVAWLRQKIEPNPRYPQFILTVHGLGYRFVAG